MPNEDPITKIRGKENIASTRESIRRKMLEGSENIHQGNFEVIEPTDLELMFHLYDNFFFQDFFSNNLKEKLNFKVSKRMTKTGGKTTQHLKKRIYTITLSSILLAQSFNNEKRKITVNGVECKDRLDAAMRIMEHELLHLLEFILFNSSNCSRLRFKKLGYNFFGHTDTKHKLVTKYEFNSKEHDLKVGDNVKFLIGNPDKNNIITGTLIGLDDQGKVIIKSSDGKENSYLSLLSTYQQP